MNKLYMMIGLPASGKSTIAKEISKKENAVIISTDSLRQEMLNNIDSQECNEIIFKEAEKRLKEHLAVNRNVIFDATNINYKKRRDWLNRFNKYNVRKIAILVATPYEECVERNLARSKQVPEEVITRMYQSFYVPQYFEGFDEIQVRYNSDYILFFEELKDIEQDNSYHTLSVLKHCEKVSQILNNEYEGHIENFVLGLAGLLHDIGKLKTKSFKNSKGEITEDAHFYNHEKVSAYDSLFHSKIRILLENEKCNRQILKIIKLIQWHMILHFNWEEKTINKYKRMLGFECWKYLESIHKADCEAR